MSELPAGLLISSGTNGFRNFLSSKLRCQLCWNLPSNFTWKCIATLSAEHHRTVTTHLLRKAVLSDIKTSRHPTDWGPWRDWGPKLWATDATRHLWLAYASQDPWDFLAHGSMLSMPSKTKWISQRSNSNEMKKKNISRPSAGFAIFGSGMKIRICELPNLFHLLLEVPVLWLWVKVWSTPHSFCQISRCISCVTKSSQGSKAVTASVCVCMWALRKPHRSAL